MTDLYFDPFSFKLHEDPYPVYRRLRDEAPLYRNDKYGFWIVSRYADCLHTARDVSKFSSAYGISLEQPREQFPSVITMDPPNHSRLRHKLSHLFTPVKIFELEERIRRLTREYVWPHLS